MKVTRYENDAERNVLIGMVMSTPVLSKIATVWKDSPFESEDSNLIGSLCIDYFKEHRKAPRKNIKAMFGAWASRQKKEEKVRMVEKLLVGLSGQAKDEINSDFVIDQARRLFDKVRLSRHIEELEAYKANGKLEDAFASASKFVRTEMGTGAYVDLMTNQDAVIDTLTRSTEKLIEYPGVLGERIVRDAFARDSFVAFMAPEKTGKTFHLMDVAFQGVLQRRKVAFFEVGDLSERQILQRFYSRVSRCPRKPCTVKYPKKMVLNSETGMAEITQYDERVFTKGLERKTIIEAMAKLKTRLNTDTGLLRVSTHPNSSINVAGIRNILEQWERSDNWVPDVVAIDYADILAPPAGQFSESRDAINANWKDMRRLSQERHCLVLTATQSKSSGYGATVLGMHDYADDKRKFAHVTGMIGLNVTTEEKENGIVRWNWIVLREDEFVSTHCVSVATCYPFSQAHVLSI